MSSLTQDIENIINRSRYSEESLLVDSRAASLQLVELFEKRMKEINKIETHVKDVEY